MNLERIQFKDSLIDSFKSNSPISDTIGSVFYNKGRKVTWEMEEVLEVNWRRNSSYLIRKFTDYDSGQLEFKVNTSFVMQNVTIMETSTIPMVQTYLAYSSTNNFLIGCFMLFLMVVPSSIIGPMTISLPAKNVFVQASWRFLGWTFLAIPLMIILYLYKGDELSFRKDFALKNLYKSVVNAFLLFMWNLGFILGCSLTITSHADIMYSSGGVYLILIAIVTGRYVHRLEYFGYGLYLFGVYLMFTDPSATKSNMDGQSYLGDLYAFLGAGCWAAFNLMNEGKSAEVHLLVTLAQNFILSTMFQLLIFPFFVGPSLFFSFNPNYGVFGFLVNFDAFIQLMWVVAPITGILGNIGFYSAYYFFPMEIVTGVMLLEPFFAQVIGVALGQDEIPGPKTVLGWTVISLGFLVAGFGAKYKETHQNTQWHSKINEDEEWNYQKMD
jgi:hypothetical protein